MLVQYRRNWTGSIERLQQATGSTSTVPQFVKSCKNLQGLTDGKQSDVYCGTPALVVMLLLN